MHRLAAGDLLDGTGGLLVRVALCHTVQRIKVALLLSSSLNMPLMKSIKIRDNQYLNPDAVESWEIGSRQVDQVQTNPFVPEPPPRNETFLKIHTLSGEDVFIAGTDADAAIAILQS